MNYKGKYKSFYMHNRYARQISIPYCICIIMLITFTYFLPGFALYVINIFIYIQQVSKEIKTRLTYRSYNHKTVKQFSHKQFTQSVYNRILLHAVRLMRLIKCQSTKLINYTCIKFRLLVSHRTNQAIAYNFT